MQHPLGPQGPPPTLFADEGERLKEEGMAQVALAESPLWIHAADKAVRFLAAIGRPFTADDVRDLAGDPRHPNAFGARLNAHARTGLIRRVGYRPSDRAERHRAIIAVWVGA